MNETSDFDTTILRSPKYLGTGILLILPSSAYNLTV